MTNIGTIEDMLNSIPQDFTNDGECSGCGSCCTALLPLTVKEFTLLKRFVERKHYKPHSCLVPLSEGYIDYTCPFRDEEKKRCDVYYIRPQICRRFKCDWYAKGQTPRIINGAVCVNIRKELFENDTQD